MPQSPDVPCSSCGRLMWRGTGSLPPGQAMCLPCRRSRKRPSAYQPKPPRVLPWRLCVKCGTPYEPRVASQRYCNPKCRQRNWGTTKTTPQRGYGAAHRRERARVKALVDQGNVQCCLCGSLINPTESWHLDHTPDRAGYRGAAHADCNLRDGARRGRARQSAPGAG